MFGVKLRDIIKDIECEGKYVDKELETEITAVISDVSSVSAGSLFAAVAGTKTDGRIFIPTAVERGAAAVIAEAPFPDDIPGCVFISVSNVRSALALAAAAFYGRPAEKLHIAGITGTNGKTSTAYMLAHIFTEYGFKCGVIGTIETVIAGKTSPASHTTPDPITLHFLLSEMVKSGCTHVVMEVSSHSLEQYRVFGVNFEVGIFTNLSVDHLDYHGDMKSYAAAKLRLFGQSENRLANRDSDFSEQFVNFPGKKRTLTFSTAAPADYRAEDIIMTSDGNRYTLIKKDCREGVRVMQQLCGIFNVYNSLAAIAAADIMGVSLADAAAAISTFASVKGRMERVPTDTAYTVMIDFAHTPDGLENVLSALKLYARHRIITVFGCGGDRDKSKRPVMGRIVAENSDIAIVTSDNPRGEDPHAIVADVLKGTSGYFNVVAIIDRKEAIAYALSVAEENDIVLLAGKGHETYQIIKDKKYPFDEREIVKEILADGKYNKNIR